MRVLALLCFMSLFMMLPASADIFTFCGTGAASCGLNGASLGSVAGNPTSGQDLNWSISFANDGVHLTSGNTYVAQPCGNFTDCGGESTNFPFNAWVAASPGDAWISPFTADTNSLPATGGEYDFTEHLNLAAQGITSGAEILGTFAADNCLIGLYVNNVLVEGTGACTTSNNFATTTAFSLTPGEFNYSGVNVITFKVENLSGGAPNPAGLLVNVTSATGISSVPEPKGTVLLGLLTAALLGAALQRRNALP